jgi:hypothetical protein
MLVAQHQLHQFALARVAGTLWPESGALSRNCVLAEPGAPSLALPKNLSISPMR